MKRKKFLVDQDHKLNIQVGLNTVYELVSKTMGPCGSNIFIDRNFLPPIITKDGATVADNINCDNKDCAPIINLIKNITRKAALESGDGTTTTTVLTYHLYKNFIDYISDKNDLRLLKITDYIRDISNQLVEELKNNSIKIKTKKELENIILISTNQDRYMTDILLDCLDVKTDDDVKDAINRDIVVSFSRNNKTYIEKIKGSRFDSGVANGAFFNNKMRNKAIVENPLMFISSSTIYNIKQIYDILVYAKGKNKPLVIIAPDFDNQVLITLASNKFQYMSGSDQGLDVTAVIAPGSGGTNTESYLEDIALLSGCNVSKPESEYSLDKINITNPAIFPKVVGESIEKFEGDNVSFTIISNIEKEFIDNKIALLKDELKTESNPVRIDTIQRRISKLKNGLSNLYICADSDIEMNERKDRIDDAVGAIKSALEEGYVAGEGVTFLALIDKIKNIDFNEREGIAAASILSKTLISPFATIIRNAELLNSNNYDYIINKTDGRKGLDTSNGEIIDLIDSGIIDPTKVLRCALQYSVSLVSTLISSSASIIEDKDELQ